MPHHSPLDAAAAEEQALQDALLARLRGVRRIDDATIRRAIRTGRYGGITGSDQWDAGLERALQQTLKNEEKLLRRGWLQAVAEIPGGAELRADTEAFVAEHAESRARSFLGDFEAVSRGNVRRITRNAAARWARNPSRALLDELVESVKARLGLTTSQARRVEAYDRVADRAELPQAVSDAEETRRELVALESRVRFAAERQAVESVNFARAAAWAEARRRGLVDVMEKRWMTQEDDRVRAHHQQQHAMGWIPFDEPFPIMGVMVPPADEPGCRCWMETRSVAARRSAA